LEVLWQKKMGLLDLLFSSKKMEKEKSIFDAANFLQRVAMSNDI
jgi:hypothetical protein